MMVLTAAEVEVLRKLVPHLMMIPGRGDVGEECDLTEDDDNALWSLIGKLEMKEWFRRGGRYD